MITITTSKIDLYFFPNFSDWKISPENHEYYRVPFFFTKLTLKIQNQNYMFNYLPSGKRHVKKTPNFLLYIMKLLHVRFAACCVPRCNEFSCQFEWGTWSGMSPNSHATLNFGCLTLIWQCILAKVNFLWKLLLTLIIWLKLTSSNLFYFIFCVFFVFAECWSQWCL